MDTWSLPPGVVTFRVETCDRVEVSLVGVRGIIAGSKATAITMIPHFQANS